jgi:hypothetical protein
MKVEADLAATTAFDRRMTLPEGVRRFIGAHR